MPFPLTIRTNPEEVEAMAGNPKPCLGNQFLGHILQTLQIRVNDLFAPGADEMGMRVRSVAVIAISPLRKTQFQDLVQFLEKGHGFVDRGQAGCGKTPFHLFVDVLYTWVPVTGSQDLEHSHALGSDSGIMPPERFQHLVETSFLMSHS
jgi:hypothetical protein